MVESTRRLSLTLLLMAPLMAAQELTDRPPDSSEAEFPISAVSGEHLPGHHHVDVEYQDDWTASSGDVLDEISSWVRRKRAVDPPGEDMETAEQILFRPIFRHRQIVGERLDHQRWMEELKRRQYQQRVAPLATPGQPLPSSLSVRRQSYPNTASQSQYSFHATPTGAVFRRPQRSVYHNPYHRHQ